MRNNKGITMISLVITIIVLLIVTSITVHNGLVQMKIKRVNNLYADIDSLSTKVAEYYLKNKTIPIYNEPYVDDKNELQVLFNNNGYETRINFNPENLKKDEIKSQNLLKEAKENENNYYEPNGQYWIMKNNNTLKSNCNCNIFDVTNY